MSADPDEVDTPPGGTVRLVVGILCGVGAVLAGLAGLGLVTVSLVVLADLEANPQPPPGNIVAIVPMAGAVVGAGLVCLGAGFGVVCVFLVRRARSRGRPDESDAGRAST